MLLLASLLPAAWGIPIDGVATTYDIIKAASADAPMVQIGNKVEVQAEAFEVTVDGKKGRKFYSTHTLKHTFKFYAGKGAFVKGFDRGTLGMKKGETRQLHIPAAEAYGDKGFTAFRIEANTDVLFEVECVDISDQHEL